MFVTRRRYREDLAAAREAVAEELAGARTGRDHFCQQADAKTAELAEGRRRYDDLMSRFLRLQQTASAEHAAHLERQVTRLQARLDDATGLNHPAVEAGALWQQRRDDKPKARKETTS